MSDDIHFMLGEMRSDIKTLLKYKEDHVAELNQTKGRVSDLENQFRSVKNKVIGFTLALGGLSGAAASKIYSFFMWPVGH